MFSDEFQNYLADSHIMLEWVCGSDMELDRYKLVVQAVVGEQRGQGFQMSCRCFWDPNTDNYAHDSFANDSVFCVAGAFAMYMY